MKTGKSGLLGRVGISRFLQWRFNAYLMWALPYKWMRAYIRMLGKIYFYLNQKEKQIIRRNIRLALGRYNSESSIQQLIQRTFRGIFTHYSEKLFIGYTNLNRTFQFLRKNVSIEGLDLLDEALAQKKGVIFVTGHYGAVEFLPTVLGLAGYTLTMLLRFKTKELKRSLNKRIRDAGDVRITLVDVTESRNVMFEAVKALKNNQIVITECDEFEKWRPCKRRHNRFLGREVQFDRSLELLQRRSKSPAIMGMFKRTPDGRYRLELHRLTSSEPQEKEEAISQKALNILEHYILEAPYQWYQWKDASYILAPEANETCDQIPATEEDRHLPLEDNPVHAF